MRRLACLFSFTAVMAWTQTSETIPFRAVLLPQNEVPAVNIAASGNATIWLHVVRDAQGRVVSASTDFDTTYRFPSDFQFTGMHIHRGRAGENGPVTIDSGIRAAEPVASTATQRLRYQGFTAPDNAAGLDTVNGLLSDPSGFYVNLHTTVNPGGVIRGQLERAEMVVLMAQMSPRNEVPAITDVNASGIGSIVALATRDGGGNLTSGLVSFDLNYTGFAEGTTFTGFHIHSGVAGVNGPVTINTGIAAGAASVPAVASGGNLHYDVEVPMTNQASVATLAGLFSGRPALYYMNLHSTVYPGGVIRAQLRSTDRASFSMLMSPANEVPPIASTASAPSSFTAHTIRNAAGAVEG
ncbi:MAG: CHRD domain-containing protein, partial [Bryobacteraceae bacterium]|nr:CHRD domain-containing protein [Bryobacteraceae bacterium]